MIPFNKPFTTGREIGHIKESIATGCISGNGPFTQRCHKLLEQKGYGKVLLTTSCTDALEMAAILCGAGPGDEIIIPAYTFVSTALAFTRQGATIVFADSRSDNPCIDEKVLESLITERTKAIVPVHYNGIACDMDSIMEIASVHGLYVIEDAAHAFGARYKGKLLGTFGHFGCFSFHETKVIHCGEGGMISINDREYLTRAEIIWEKGTNRAEFRRGRAEKYQWIDTGSSFLMSDLNAAFLFDQIISSDQILNLRKEQWLLYFKSLSNAGLEGKIKLPEFSTDCSVNHAGFYIMTESITVREKLGKYLSYNGIQAVSHYLDLGESPFINKQYGNNITAIRKNSRKYEERLLRLPLYHDLKNKEIIRICKMISGFFGR